MTSTHITFTKISELFYIIVCNTHWTFFSQVAKYLLSKICYLSFCQSNCSDNLKLVCKSTFHSFIWIKPDISTGRRDIRWPCKVGLHKSLHPVTFNLPAELAFLYTSPVEKTEAAKWIYYSQATCWSLCMEDLIVGKNKRKKGRKQKNPTLLFCCFTIITKY